MMQDMIHCAFGGGWLLGAIGLLVLLLLTVSVGVLLLSGSRFKPDQPSRAGLQSSQRELR